MKFRYWRGDVFRRITAISALVASLLFTTTASAALLSALLEGETITVQDKVFSNFSYSSTGTESQFQSAAAIVVSGFVTANGQVQLRVDLNASVRWELGLPAQSATGILAFDVDVLGSMELIEAVRVTSVFDTSPGGSAEMFVEFEDADSSHFFGFLLYCRQHTKQPSK